MAEYLPRAEAWFDRVGEYPTSPGQVEGVTFHRELVVDMYQPYQNGWVLVMRHPGPGQICSVFVTATTRGSASPECGDDSGLTITSEPHTVAAGEPITFSAVAALERLTRDLSLEDSTGNAPVALIAWKVGSAPWNVGTVETHRAVDYRLPRPSSHVSVELLVILLNGRAFRGTTTVRTTSAFYSPADRTHADSVTADSVPAVIPHPSEPLSLDTTTSPAGTSDASAAAPATPTRSSPHTSPR
jgi:hypothetical protein